LIEENFRLSSRIILITTVGVRDQYHVLGHTTLVTPSGRLSGARRLT